MAYQFGPLEAMMHVQQQGEYGKRQGQQTRLGRLVSQGMSEPGGLSRIAPEVAKIDHRAGIDLQSYGEDQQDRQRDELVRAAKLYLEAPQQMRGQVYSQIAPGLTQLGLQMPPQDGPEVEQAARALVQAYGGSGDAGVFAQKVGEDGYIYNAMRDGTMVNTGVKADRQMWFRDHQGMDPQLVGKDGSVTTIGAPQGQPATAPQGQPAPAPSTGNGDPKMDAIVQAANAMRAAGIPPPQIEEWMQQAVANTPGVQVGPPQGAPTMQPTGNPVMPPAAPPQQPAPPPLLRRPSAAEDAAAVEAARRRTALEFADREAEAAADAARLKMEAEAGADKAINAPQAAQKAQETIALIDLAINHPGRATATGFSGAIDPRNYVPGTDATDFRVVLDQLGGRAFLEAFESLKGGGQITEVEGRKATEAMARLSRAQSDEAFVSALQELRDIAISAKARAESARDGQQTAGPQPGQVEEGYRFKGGNPADPANWERV